MDYYPSRIAAVPLTDIRRQRMLPMPGEILVGIGDRVEPTQVLAQTSLPGDLELLQITRLLGVSGSQFKKCLRVKLGDEVQEGQVIAAKGGLFGGSVKAPINGIVVAIGGGRVLIEGQPELFELRAYINGMVSNVVDGWGALVETTGALIEGAWGGGGEGYGVLRCAVRDPGEPLQVGDIDPSSHGMILVGGSGLDRDTLVRAQELQVRGIVIGGISPELVPEVERSPLPIVVTEGIGQVSMSAPVFDLFLTHDGREASMSGAVRPRWGINRPEIIIRLPAEAVPPEAVGTEAPLRVGSRVRLIRAPYMGQVGVVTDIPAHARRIETGVRVRCAEVDVGQKESVFVPLANLEVFR